MRCRPSVPSSPPRKVAPCPPMPVHSSIPMAIISLLTTIAIVYALLVAVYVATCLVVTRMNRTIAAAKIQARETAPALVARDRRQSLVSLLGIAAMFGVGHWAYATLGWGWPAPSGVVGTILSAI